MIVQSIFVLILSAGYGITTAEFMGKAACDNALAAYMAVNSFGVKGVCVPKMVVPSDAK